jgi:hypothetical protein
MEYAEAMGAEYVVFHVNDVSNEEVISYEWEHTDEEVIRAVAEIVNELTRGKNYHFKLLFENLFTPGMMLLKPSETALMLELTDYENKGILKNTVINHIAEKYPFLTMEGLDTPKSAYAMQYAGPGDFIVLSEEVMPNISGLPKTQAPLMN